MASITAAGVLGYLIGYAYATRSGPESDSRFRAPCLLVLVSNYLRQVLSCERLVVFT